METIKISFEAGEGKHFPGAVNFMKASDDSIYAECEVPNGAEEDYGYMSMRDRIIAACGSDKQLSFWYDGQERFLSDDAYVNCQVYMEIEA